MDKLDKRYWEKSWEVRHADNVDRHVNFWENKPKANRPKDRRFEAVSSRTGWDLDGKRDFWDNVSDDKMYQRKLDKRLAANDELERSFRCNV